MTFEVLLRTAHLVADRPIILTVSPCIFAPENVMAEDDAPVVTKRIDAAVVSIRIVEAEEREKINFSNPEDGAEMVKLLSVAVPVEIYDIP